MLSRVASSLFWMARNVERAESNARVLESRLINALETSEYGAVAVSDWETVLDICASTEEYRTMYDACEPKDIAYYISFHRYNINSILNCMENARNNARSIRDIIPEELWETLNAHYLTMQDEDYKTWSIRRVHRFLQEIKTFSYTMQGIVESCMLREEAYHFIKIGKWLERAEKTSRVLNVVCEKTKEAEELTQTSHYYYWLSALQFLNGHDAYLKRFPPTMEPSQVLSFLISYEQFPRSIEYCMEHVREGVMKLEDGKVSHYSEELFNALDHVTNEFMKIKFQKISTEEIGPFLDRFQNDCNRISYLFAGTYYFV
ncbi:alpha-E domain-containing protein [Alkalicoccus halolimnae]|uniref:Alpha-E domain-containing protein n=1 Tax=Alkalicoccus halolimnae TaxID=1667239 RepID=A0A5C7FBK8_9BACI|nr:alpha-E domain-containing protein [Alkalicoccus halolimnae]TXF86870.1 alpha-E domain-containing protein [Alkalicoccus halolimnae]